MDNAASEIQRKDGIKVLLVDDQRIIGEAIKRMLEPEKDIVFLHCSDPASAIKTVGEFRPAVILQDLVMPGVDGMDLVQAYKADASIRDIPVIVLSSEEDADIKVKAYNFHANDYMVKIPHRVELVAKIREHAKGSIAQRRFEEAQAELQRLKSVVEMASWLDAVACVASSIVYDLETPVQYIVGNMMFVSDAFRSLTRFRARLARLAIPPDIAAAMKEAADQEELDFVFDDAPKAFRQSQAEMDRASAMIRILRAMPLAQGVGNPVPVEVNALLKDFPLLLKERLAAVAELKFSLAEGLPDISVRTGELSLSILLLLVGAAAAMKERFGSNARKGLLEVESRLEGSEVKISFKDNGSPVGAAIVETLLEPVPKDSHSRRGLHAVRRIAELAGASFELKPSEDSGCTIVLGFPAAS